ncbi:3-phosphoshikimate 1-carboxyvinyltransferase [Trifolium repens]|nr:3-phosphoshikimate 1-carboxyvinyltransferase [Trifolium repens]
MGRGNSFVLKASASVAADEKPSTAPEIVLEPISEIFGTITLPGSKSLSNRILLLAALSERDLSTSSEHDPGSLSNVTPSKRSSTDQSPKDLLRSQLSFQLIPLRRRRT